MITAGDLIEVIDPGPRGIAGFTMDWTRHNPNKIRPGMRGVVLTSVLHPWHSSLTPCPENGHCVQFGAIHEHIHMSCMRKISEPPDDTEQNDREAHDYNMRANLNFARNLAKSWKINP